VEKYKTFNSLKSYLEKTTLPHLPRKNTPDKTMPAKFLFKTIRIKEKQDIVLMPRPNLKETFLKTALQLSKKETTILSRLRNSRESFGRNKKRRRGKNRIFVLMSHG